MCGDGNKQFSLFARIYLLLFSILKQTQTDIMLTESRLSGPEWYRCDLRGRS